MTGIPSAQRSGEAFANDDVQRGVGNALMAAPSRLAGLPGWLLTQPADAQAPDPRLQRIKDLDAAIAKERKTLDSYANRQFPSTVARNAANKAVDDAIASYTAQRDRLQGEIDAEFVTQRQRQDAADRGAEWAKTPMARRYPGSTEALATAGAVTSFARSE